MDQHPIPRQITTFEFKLIGSLTVRQFVYLAVFISSGVTFFFIIPIPFINILIATAAIAMGVVIVFVPFNERPIDVWIMNLIKRLSSPVQYYYFKKNSPPAFLQDVFIYSSPKTVENHIDARQKLTSYVTSQVSKDEQSARKQNIHDLLYASGVSKDQEITVGNGKPATKKTSVDQKSTSPFLLGTVQNNLRRPLPNILIYIKDQNNSPLRILKTNSSGQFATFYPLSVGKYFLETKDPDEKHFFDKMEVSVGQKNPIPISIVSRELI